MFLLGLSWIILLFTVVGADTNINAAFAIQWLFVFFNSLQGFFLFVFFVVVNRDARNLWFKFLCRRLAKRKAIFSTTPRHTSTSGNTATTQASSQQYSSDTSKAAVRKEKYKEEIIVSNYFASYNEDSNDSHTEPTSGDASTLQKPSKNPPQIQIKHSSSIQNTHDIEIAEVTFDKISRSEDEETSL